MADQLSERTGVGRDDGQAGRHRLHGREALQFRLRGDGEDVSQPVQARQVLAGDEADEPHPAGQSKLVSPGVQDSFVRAGARYSHLRVPGEPRRRAEQHVDALLRAEPANRQDQRPAGQQAIAIPDPLVGRPRRVRLQVDAIGDDP